MQRTLRKSKRGKRKILDSVKLIDEKVAEKGLSKLIQTLSEEVKVPETKAANKERAQIVTRETRNLRSTKNKDIPKSIEVKDSNSSIKQNNDMYIPKESKVTIDEEQQNKPLVKTDHPIYSKEEVRQTPAPTPSEPIDRLELRTVQEMPVRARKNLLHGAIAKFIKANKVE